MKFQASTTNQMDLSPGGYHKVPHTRPGAVTFNQFLNNIVDPGLVHAERLYRERKKI